MHFHECCVQYGAQTCRGHHKHQPCNQRTLISTAYVVTTWSVWLTLLELISCQPLLVLPEARLADSGGSLVQQTGFPATSFRKPKEIRHDDQTSITAQRPGRNGGGCRCGGNATHGPRPSAHRDQVQPRRRGGYAEGQGGGLLQEAGRRAHQGQSEGRGLRQQRTL